MYLLDYYLRFQSAPRKDTWTNIPEKYAENGRLKEEIAELAIQKGLIPEAGDSKN